MSSTTSTRLGPTSDEPISHFQTSVYNLETLLRYIYTSLITVNFTKENNTKVPKRQVSTIKPHQHKTCSDVTDRSAEASHWSTSSHRTLAPHHTQLSKHFLFVSPTSGASGRFKWGERERGLSHPPREESTEGSSLDERDKTAGARAARLLLHERIYIRKRAGRQTLFWQSRHTGTVCSARQQQQNNSWNCKG